ncbi:hydrogenase maturation protein [Pseudonocardia oroxyli]|uniref:Putative two-component system protein, hydrogenase maturation factor HypX/HoxX n=1 Tax=Pseudonocardia oroxyli TaxID=366584 RepID=A0A1G7VBS3_PSEOR|nr:hydrogenase maturation protein [Pseudonocardia oroxyli]SDG57011.1 putative two-component system protein, hydrogenase maturation factor HypX/HoxX [Pseudonocardia oroxyli]
MRILLLCSSYNGLTQRAWTELREDGHHVEVRLSHDEDAIRRAVADTRPELVLCPFLKDRVPADVWQAHRVVVLHPGPLGDRGPSSIDWAITDAEPVWGVTALQAVEEMDAGPIWGHRTFPMPSEPPRKSAVYNGPVADAAIELAREVVAKAQDPAFEPAPVESFGDAVIGRLRPTMKQSDRVFTWEDPTDHVLRRIRAADGSPGVRTQIAGVELSVFDAHRGSATPGAPGSIALRRHGAVLVRTGDGAVWIGHARVPKGIKLPAATVLAGHLDDVPESLERPTGPSDGYREISYRRVGPDGCVGVVRMDLYNGAMSASQGHRVAAALRHAAAQDTRVVVLEAGEVFSNGIHLNVAEGRPDPTVESWRNINAINDVCRELLTCTSQLVVTAVGGPAGAGGVMLALGADTVLLREGAVLNPHYRNMGLTGSEYWTYALPRRVGLAESLRLTGDCLPVGHAEALRIGLVDAVVAGDRAAFDAAVLERAVELATADSYAAALAAKQAAREADELRRPLETYRVQELAEMSRDMFDDRYRYAALRHDFVAKAKDTSFDDPTIARSVREAGQVEELVG